MLQSASGLSAEPLNVFYSVMPRVLEASLSFSYTVNFSALEWIWTDDTAAGAAAPLSEISAYTNPVLQALRVAIYQALASGGEPCASVLGASEHSVTIVAHESSPEPSQGMLTVPLLILRA